MALVHVKEEPQELIELDDSDDNGDNMFMFDIDEEANRSMIEMMRRRRNRRSASVSRQPRFGPLANSLSPARFGTPPNPSRLTICEDDDDAEPVQTKADFVHAVLTAVQLARLRKYLNFEQLHELVAGGAFVRLLSGAQKKIDQIVGILCCDEPYECDLLDTTFDMRFQTLWSGVCRLTQIAAQPAEEMADSEFERWKEEMQRRRLKLPTLEFVSEKNAEFSKALAQIEREHSSDADYPALRVRLDEQDDDLMPAGCFSETDEETDDMEEQQKRHSSLYGLSAQSVRPPSRGAASSSPILPHYQSTHSQSVGDPPVDSADDVKEALLMRGRLIQLYANNPFDQFERAVLGCFVRVNTGQLGYKLDQLEMVSETAMEPYTLKGHRQCRVILHLTLHGRRRINAVAFASFRGSAQADTEFHEWHSLMTQKRVPLPSKRFVALKVAQLTAFDAEKEKPPPPPSSNSNSAPEQPPRHQIDPSDSAAVDAPSGENADNGNAKHENDQQDDDVQLVNDVAEEQSAQLTPDDLRSIALTARDLIELFEREPSVEKRREMLSGCFVRVYDHSLADKGETVHRLHQIVHVQKGVHYRLRNAFVDMHLTLRGESDALRCDNVSGKPFTGEEFEEWAQRTREKGFPAPTKLFIAQKMEQLGRANPNELSGRKTFESPQPKTKRKQLKKKRSWMALFRTDSGGEERGETAAKGVEEKRNRPTPKVTMPPRTGSSSFSTISGRTTKHGQGQRHPYARPKSLLSLPSRPPAFYYSSPVSSAFRSNQSSKNDNEDEWNRKTERFITRTVGFVGNALPSPFRAYRPREAMDVDGLNGAGRLERSNGGADGTWRRTSAPAEHSKTEQQQQQQLWGMDDYMGHRPMSTMSAVERNFFERSGGYGDAPRAITPSALSTADFGVVANSGIGPYFSSPSADPLKCRPYSSDWAPNSNYTNTSFGNNISNNNNNNAMSNTDEPTWSARRVQPFDAFMGGGRGGDSSDEEPMVARARRQVMDTMEPIGVGAGGGHISGTGLPWHELQEQQLQRRTASPNPQSVVHKQQQTAIIDNNFKLFEKRWYNNDNQLDNSNKIVRQFEQRWYNNDTENQRCGELLRSPRHYSTPRSHDNPRRHQQHFFSAPSRHYRRVSPSPPTRTPGVPSFFFSADRR